MELPQRHVAGLPMYDFAELQSANDMLWDKIRCELSAAGIADLPATLSRDLSHAALWCHPKLILAQACEYPLATSYAGVVRLVATPCYSAPGCSGSLYSSALIVRRDETAASLAEMRGRRCVVNEPTSNSGMNLLRAAVAPLANGERFFAAVDISGSHRQSAEALADGLADLAAIDCVTLAHLKQIAPDLTARLRILSWTEASPSLPFVTAACTDDATLAALRSALSAATDDPALAAARRRLFFEGFDFKPDERFQRVRALADQAVAHGYPVLH